MFTISLQEKAEELKRQQAEAIRRMQQEQMADMQVSGRLYLSHLTCQGMHTLTEAFDNFNMYSQINHFHHILQLPSHAQWANSSGANSINNGPTLAEIQKVEAEKAERERVEVRLCAHDRSLIEVYILFISPQYSVRTLQRKS